MYSDLLSLGFPSVKDVLTKRFTYAASEIESIYGVFFRSLHEDRQAAVVNGVDTSDVVAMVCRRIVFLGRSDDSEGDAGWVELGVPLQFAEVSADDPSRQSGGSFHVATRDNNGESHRNEQHERKR